jgi:MoaA/NifB/PqqE/SkfB family radical SAM enzyme
MVVDHHFPGVWRRGLLLFHRAAAWASLFLKTNRFEKVNATPNEVLTGVLTWLCLLFLLASPWQPMLLWGASLLLVACTWLTRDYLSFALEQERRALIPALLLSHWFWSATAVLGGIWGMICSPFERGLKAVRAARFVFSRLPTQLVFFVTARCNARCAHCFYWNEIENADRARELSLEEIEKIAKGFGHVKLLSLTGGEPTLRKDLPQIAQIFRKHNGLEHVSVHTNGLRSGEIVDLVRRMARDNPEVEINIAVSIDGFESTHDELRGIPGLFQSCLTTLSGLIRAKASFSNLNVTVNSCFTRTNQDELKGLIDYFSTRFELDGFYVSLVRGHTKDPSLRAIDLGKYREVIQHRQNSSIASKRYKNFPLASFKQTLEFLTPELVIETIEREKTVYPCTAGKGLVVIDQYGEVSPCEMLTKKFGNLRDADYSISRLLRSVHGRSVRKFISDRNCACTWECAQINSTIFNWRAYPRFFSKWMQLRSLAR